MNQLQRGRGGGGWGGGGVFVLTFLIPGVLDEIDSNWCQTFQLRP